VKVFISWSGARSRFIAQALRVWLTDVIQVLQPWMSDSDIPAGGRWGEDLRRELSQAGYGILCLTPENVAEPWILFEAGAIANQVEAPLVCPYLVGGLRKATIPEGPLSLFQAKEGTKDDTWALLRTLNLRLGDHAQNESDLRRRFETSWPRLQGALSNMPAVEAETAPAPSQQDMLEEMLVRVRRIEALSAQRSDNAARREVVKRRVAALGSADERWQELVSAVNLRKRLLGAFLDESSAINIEGNELSITSDDLHLAVLGEKDNLAIIMGEARRIFGNAIEITLLQVGDTQA